MAREVLGQGEDGVLRVDGEGLAAGRAPGQEFNAIPSRNDVEDDHALAQAWTGKGFEMRDDGAVAGRPGNELGCARARFFHAGGEIEDARPRGGICERAAIVVAAAVFDVPAQPRALPAALIEELGHRDLIEGVELRRAVGGGAGDAKRALLMVALQGHEALDLRFERVQLAEIFFARGGAWIEAVVPLAADEEALLRGAAEQLFGDDRPAVVIASGYHLHIGQ